MFIRNGKKIQPSEPFTLGEDAIQYPPPSQLSSEDLSELGITEVPDPTRPDDRYYWVTENEDGTFSATPKDLPALRTAAVTQIYAACASLLTPTDHAIVRSIEVPTEAVYPATLQYRAACRAAADAAVAAVNAAVDIPSLLTASVALWPAPLGGNTLSQGRK